MKCEIEKKNDIIILRIQENRLNNEAAPELKSQILDIAKNGDDKLLIDLAQVEYADSSGLGAILFGIRQYRSPKKALKIVYPQPRVLMLIKIAKLDQVIESYDSEEEALTSFDLIEE